MVITLAQIFSCSVPNTVCAKYEPLLLHSKWRQNSNLNKKVVETGQICSLPLPELSGQNTLPNNMLLRFWFIHWRLIRRTTERSLDSWRKNKRLYKCAAQSPQEDYRPLGHRVAVTQQIEKEHNLSHLCLGWGLRSFPSTKPRQRSDSWWPFSK